MKYLSSNFFLIIAMLTMTMAVQAAPHPAKHSSQDTNSKASAKAQAALGSAKEP
ncbi:hypothetical protein IWQ61_010575, partial [Dispira simplex]